MGYPAKRGVCRAPKLSPCTCCVLRRFLRSQAARDFVGFLLDLNEAVRGKALSDPCPASPAVGALLEV